MTYRIPRYKCKLVRDGSVAIREDLHKPITGEAQAIKLFKWLTDESPVELLMVAYLDAKGVVTGFESVSQGGRVGCATTAAEVFRGAILHNAYSIIVGHNHPSGDPTPSPEDRTMTHSIRIAGNALGIKMLDHIIVTRTAEHFSFLANGLC
jgi:DNA repair protein RadC